jgi:hypothetical protein
MSLQYNALVYLAESEPLAEVLKHDWQVQSNKADGLFCFYCQFVSDEPNYLRVRVYRSKKPSGVGTFLIPHGAVRLVVMTEFRRALGFVANGNGNGNGSERLAGVGKMTGDSTSQRLEGSDQGFAK